MLPADLLVSIVHAMALGACYGAYGFVTKRDRGETFKLKKFVRTLVLWGVAGAFVHVVRGVDPTGQNIQEEYALLVVLGVLFDMGWSKLEREGHIPEWMYREVETPV